MFWLNESQKAINCVCLNQILEISHREGSCNIDKCSDVTPSVTVNASISYYYNAHYQEIKNMYIYRVSMNRGVVPYNFDPEYSIEKINSRHYLMDKNTNATIPLFCTIRIIFQKVIVLVFLQNCMWKLLLLENCVYFRLF